MNTLTEPEVQARAVAYLPLVESTAHVTHTSLEFDDRCQEGFLGLVHALRHFDEQKSPAFARYARKCIRGFILHGTETSCNQFGLPKDKYWIGGAITQLSIDAMPEYERDQLLGLSQTSKTDIDQQELQTELERVMATLTERERTVLRLRFGLDGNPPQILSDLGRRLRITAEGVRQIERKALKKLELRICREKVGRDATRCLSGKLKRVS